MLASLPPVPDQQKIKLLKTRQLIQQIFAVAFIAFTCGIAFAQDRGSDIPVPVVLYAFNKIDGKQIKDDSEFDKPLNLTISNTNDLGINSGFVEIRKSASLSSQKAAAKVITPCKNTNEITVEAWITPANTKQDGPARIVSLSSDTSNRNFTLGQDGDKFDVRLRTTKTSRNGLPSIATKSKTVTTKLTHIVYTRDKRGNAAIYINGQSVATRNVPGDFTNWDSKYHLILGNEKTEDRPWLGKLHVVAIYNRALPPSSIKELFDNGSERKVSPEILAERKRKANTQLFETKVAAILARRCLECHDPANSQGKLDLSSKVAAFNGGENGAAIVPGNPGKSLLLDFVDSDEMPKKREPLSSSEKTFLRDWIANGAHWSLDSIDPAVYAIGSGNIRPSLQRLTINEYIATVKATVGVDIEKDTRRILPADLRADGFSNTAYNLTVDLKHVSAYAELAAIIVKQIDVDKFAKRFSKSRRLIDKDNRKLIEDMGKWLLRGPVSEREIAAYRGIVTTAMSSGADFTEAMSAVIEAMLQSPRFIYRIEQPSGPLSQFELASRISYIVTGGPPDELLIQDADAGKLNDSSMRGHVQRLMETEAAKQRSEHFVSDWLHLSRLDNMRPNKEHFPKWNKELAADMKRETQLYFEDVVWQQKRPMSALLDSQIAYLTPRLAQHYGMSIPLLERGEHHRKVDVSKIPERGGILTHGSVLTIGGDEASMVTRGLFVMNHLLRGVVKDPPACVDTTPVPSKPGLTQRLVAEGRIANKNCGGCHSKFEPLAFGLEKFNGLGTYKTKDRHGNQLRDDGNILFPGTAQPREYQTSRQLMTLLAESRRVKETLTWKVTQFAMGRPLGPADAKTVTQIHKESQANGGTYQSLIIAIIESDLVQKRTIRHDY